MTQQALSRTGCDEFPMPCNSEMLHRGYPQLKFFYQEELPEELRRYCRESRQAETTMREAVSKKVRQLLNQLAHSSDFPEDALRHMAIIPMPGGLNTQMMRKRFAYLFAGNGSRFAQQVGISPAGVEETQAGYLLVFCSLEERARTWERARATLKKIRRPISQDLAQLRFIRAQEFIWAYAALAALQPHWVLGMLGSGMVRTKLVLPSSGRKTPGVDHLGFGYPDPRTLHRLHWVPIPEVSAQPHLGVIYAAFFPI